MESGHVAGQRGALSQLKLWFSEELGHNRCTHALWVLLFLVSLTTLLHSYGKLRAFDDVMLAIVANAGATPTNLLNGLDVQPRVVALMISREMFGAYFGRRLPIDRGRLADVVRSVANAHPSLIAIDVDVAPPEDKMDAGTNDLYQAIEDAVRGGIRVVAMPYERWSHESRCRRNRCLLDLCTRIDAPATKAKKTRVKPRDKTQAECPRVLPDEEKDLSKDRRGERLLYLASPHLPTVGNGLSVVEFPLRRQKEDGPMGVGQRDPVNLGIAAGSSAWTDLPDYCEQLRKLAGLTCTPEDRNDHRLAGVDFRQVDEPAGPAREFINYQPDNPRKQVIEISLDSLAQIELEKANLTGRIVIIGVVGYSGADEFATPIGRLNGALVHAHIANSVDQPVKDDHRLGAATDFALGFLFAAGGATLHLLQSWLARIGWANLSRLVGLFGLPTLLVVATGVVLWASPVFMGRGVWLNPLPIFLGLTAHTYLEALDGHSAEALPEHRSGPLHRRLERAHLPAGSREHSGSSCDRLLGAIIRAAMALVIAWAAWLLIQGE